MQLMACMSKNPAEFYRMIPGSVTQDAPADLVIFGEKERWTVDHFASKASNSPFKAGSCRVRFTIRSAPERLFIRDNTTDIQIG